MFEILANELVSFVTAREKLLFLKIPLKYFWHSVLVNFFYGVAMHKSKVYFFSLWHVPSYALHRPIDLVINALCRSVSVCVCVCGASIVCWHCLLASAVSDVCG